MVWGEGFIEWKARGSDFENDQGLAEGLQVDEVGGRKSEDRGRRYEDGGKAQAGSSKQKA